MLVQYYKNPNITYASRRRYNSIPAEPFNYEEQKTILLGDGANTSIKTKKDNICDYVTIDDTRWFVTSYEYLNGGQVQLFLQRDVIGEFGLYNCYGKIERGYTNTILKNRKELGLNQILKKRQSLIPDKNTYGNYTVNNHTNEMWGLLYLVKPKDGVDEFNINIPDFAPKLTNLEYKPFTEYVVSSRPRSYLDFNLFIQHEDGYNVQYDFYYKCNISFNKQGNNVYWNANIKRIERPYYISVKLELRSLYQRVFPTEGDALTIAKDYCNYVGSKIRDNVLEGLSQGEGGFSIPETVLASNDIPYEYDGINLEYNGKVFNYYFTETTVVDEYGYYPDKYIFYEKVFNFEGRRQPPHLSNANMYYTYDEDFVGSHNFICSFYNETAKTSLEHRELNQEELGQLNLVIPSDYVDQPYGILAFPLYNVEIDGNSKHFNINKEVAFSIFNETISFLSGESGYLVDAQIYPYCPDLISVSSSISKPDNPNGIYPFFSIGSTFFERTSKINLYPYSDVKKEYISREYSIVSPDKTDKFSFNFYDYKKNIIDNNGINNEQLSIKIKTSLKPFSILSSAVIQPDNETLKNMTYTSELDGCQPSANGFECSLSTNQFQEYARNNSNYEKIFNKNQEYLAKQHQVEKVNDITAAVVNTISAASMGAIAGASVADTGFGNLFGSKAMGALAGGTVAGVTVGAAMATQTAMNEELRNYEYNLQKEMFDLEIGTIKNRPNLISRISSFNELILRDFWFVIETYECSEYELEIVEEFIKNYSYGIGVFGFFESFCENGWFLRGDLITSSYITNLHNIANNELKGGIYYYGN